MQQFNAQSLIHKTLYKHLGIHYVSSEERAKLDAVWNNLDSDSNGTLKKKDLKKFHVIYMDRKGINEKAKF